MILKKVRPMLNHIITTADRYEEVQLKDGLITSEKSEGEIKEFQTVIAVGPNAFGVKEGDLILINPKEYLVPVHSLNSGSVLEKSKDEVQYQLNLPVIEINGKQCLFLFDRDIDLIVDEYE